MWRVMVFLIGCAGAGGGGEHGEVGSAGDAGSTTVLTDACTDNCPPPHAVRWQRAFPGYLWGVAVDEVGDVYAVGTITGTADLGAGLSVTPTSSSQLDMLVAKWGSDGVPRWAKQFTSDGGDTQGRAIHYADGHVYAGGGFSGTVTVAGVAHAARMTDALVVQLDAATGDIQKATAFGSENDDAIVSISSGGGAVQVCGTFDGKTLQTPNGQLTSQASINGFVSSFGSSAGFDRLLGDSTAGHTSRCSSVAVDALGNIDIVGVFDGTATIAGAPVSSAKSIGYVAQYRGDGTPVWARVFASAIFSAAESVVLDASGNPTAVGEFDGAVDFGGGPLASSTNWGDAYVASYSSTGDFVAVRHYADNLAFRAAATTSDGLVATGITGGPAPDLDPNVALGEFFVVGLGGATPSFSKLIGGTGADQGTSVAVASNGLVAITGCFAAGDDIGLGTMNTPGALVMMLDP